MPFKPQTVKYAIFDLDGLLLNTEPVYDEIFAHYARLKGVSEQDITVKLPSIRQKMYGKKKEDSARLFIDGLHIPVTVEAWLSWRSANENSFFAHAQPMPGAEALITQLQAKKIPLAIATSSTQELWQVKSQPYPWLKSIPVIVTADQVSRGKPAPDHFLATAQQLGAAPQHCLVFEDAVNGVEGALAAGMSVIFVPTGNPPAEDIARLKQLYPDYDQRVQTLASLTEFSVPA